ncbi:unnamed protein product [Effrenium voratum]|nr:unnamed protein product [Effrenium voratum]
MNGQPGFTVELLKALERGDLSLVQTELAKGADVPGGNQDGCSPLMRAARHGHLPIVEALVSASADIHAEDVDGETALTWAAWGCHLDVVRFFEEHGADMDHARRSGCTALMHVAHCGDLRLAKLLLPKARVNRQNKLGLTPLMWASRGGHLPMVELLHSARADLDAADGESRTALAWAAMRGHGQVVSFLTDQQALLNHQDQKGETALVKAAKHHQSSVVRLLLDKRADPSIQRSDGKTASSVARLPDVKQQLQAAERRLAQVAPVAVPQGLRKVPSSVLWSRGKMEIEILETLRKEEPPDVLLPEKFRGEEEYLLVASSAAAVEVRAELLRRSWPQAPPEWIEEAEAQELLKSHVPAAQMASVLAALSTASGVYGGSGVRARTLLSLVEPCDVFQLEARSSKPCTGWRPSSRRGWKRTNSCVA